MLEAAIAEIEQHLHASGWDRPPTMFALVHAGQFSADEPEAAGRLGVDRLDAGELTSIEQEALPQGPLDEVLAGIAWPPAVAGCALSQEIVILPPAAESELAAESEQADSQPDGHSAERDSNAGEDAARAADHPQRREARLVVGVLRDGTSAAVLRLRAASADDADGDLLTGPDLAPNLVAALLATLDD